MSKRSRREAEALEALRRGEAEVARPTGGQRYEDGWVVRPVTGTPGRDYRCPGCDQEVRGGVPHLVVWPEGDEDDRRHWHSACWSARDRRTVKVHRSKNAPRYG